MIDRIVAIAEDDAIIWIDGAQSKRAARGEVARIWMTKRPRWIRLAIEAEHMRPSRSSEEGWMTVCEADHPDAEAVWQITPREPPYWWSRLRQMIGRLYCPRPRGVLWGCRPDRYLRRWERPLARPGQLVKLGDYQLATIEMREHFERQRKAEQRARAERMKPLGRYIYDAGKVG